jgi:uncharacterized protein
MTTRLQELPHLGVGLGFREQLAEQILSRAHEIDWLELITDNFIRRTPAFLIRAEQLRQRFRLIPHGLEMSVGSSGPLDEEYLRDVADFVDAVRAPWFSDHLCFTREGNIELGSLIPIDRTFSSAVEVARKAQHVQEVAGRPFLLENITYYVEVQSDLEEAQFISAVLDNCECGLLLDVTNLWINSINHGFDPRKFLDAIPADRVVQVHVAGGYVTDEGRMIDSHSYPVPDEVWQLLADLSQRTDLRGVLLERDGNFPPDFGVIMAELESARTAVGWEKVRKDR